MEPDTTEREAPTVEDRMADRAARQRMTLAEREERAAAMHRYYEGPPERTLAEVGQQFGVTSERVRQVFGQFGYTVRYPRPYGTKAKKAASKRAAKRKRRKK